MNPAIRRAFPFVVILFACGAMVWAVSFSELPPADYTFNNGTDVKTIDPPSASGAPEGRVIDGLFEGLYRLGPADIEFDANGNVTKWPEQNEYGIVPMVPQPAMAQSCEISEDGRTYTFTMREGALWTNQDGSKTAPVTADDFLFSWHRMLHPETGSRYASLLTEYVVGARAYNTLTRDIGDRVEVELYDRADSTQNFPRGTIERGVLRQIGVPPEVELGEGASKKEKQKAEDERRARFVYFVEIKPIKDSEVQWDQPGQLRAFSQTPIAADVAKKELAKFDIRRERVESSDDESSAKIELPISGLSQTTFAGEVEKCHQVLTDFASTVGLSSIEDGRKFVVELMNPTSYWLELCAFYPLYPVNPACVMEHGTPNWTKPDKIMTNGPFTLTFRRVRDRVRMKKSPHYWNAKIVKVETVDALAIDATTAGLNLFLNNQCDWHFPVPTHLIADFKGRDDFVTGTQLATYFYRLHVNRPPLDDVHVRRALNMAIDKEKICEFVTQAGETPASHMVPPIIQGYASPQGLPFDPEAAKAELAKSKYAGKPLPTIEILYNTSEGHRAIAEVIQQQWKNNLGIDVKLVNQEWGSFLDTVHQKDYCVARAGWIGDYEDANTFLSMWLTGGENNETGWSNKDYDKLLRSAAAEPDKKKRAEMMHDAEKILLEDQPIIPIYFYVTKNIVSPRVVGFFPTVQDRHPIHLIRIREPQ